MRKFKDVFGPLPDPRAANARHDLWKVLVVGPAAPLCGAKSRSDVATSERRSRNCCGSSSAWSTVFRATTHSAGFSVCSSHKPWRRLSVGSWRPLRGQWTQAHRGWWPSTARRCAAPERGGKATLLHLVNVFAVDARMALAQQKAPVRNETAGALEVLDLLSLEGCIVTADALHCSSSFASAVLGRGGDYALTIKSQRWPFVQNGYATFARSGRRSTTPTATIGTRCGAPPSCATPVWLRSTAFPESPR